LKGRELSGDNKEGKGVRHDGRKKVGSIKRKTGGESSCEKEEWPGVRKKLDKAVHEGSVGSKVGENEEQLSREGKKGEESEVPTLGSPS